MKTFGELVSDIRDSNMPPEAKANVLVIMEMRVAHLFEVAMESRGQKTKR